MKNRKCINNFITFVVAANLLVLSSCSENHNSNVTYSAMENLPYNIEINTDAVSRITKEFPDVKMFETEYPSMNALVKYAIVVRKDSLSTDKVITAQLEKMADDVIHDDCGIVKIKGNDGISGWVFSSAPDKYPVQMLATDSFSVVLHGRMEFTSPQTDSAGVVFPAVEAIAADMEHIVKNLKLK